MPIFFDSQKGNVDDALVKWRICDGRHTHPSAPGLQTTAQPDGRGGRKRVRSFLVRSWGAAERRNGRRQETQITTLALGEQKGGVRSPVSPVLLPPCLSIPLWVDSLPHKSAQPLLQLARRHPRWLGGALVVLFYALFLHFQIAGLRSSIWVTPSSLSFSKLEKTGKCRSRRKFKTKVGGGKRTV